MAPPPEEISAGSILRELIFNQYQAIVAAGAVAASALTLNPLPLLLWLGSRAGAAADSRFRVRCGGWWRAGGAPRPAASPTSGASR